MELTRFSCQYLAICLLNIWLNIALNSDILETLGALNKIWVVSNLCPQARAMSPTCKCLCLHMLMAMYLLCPMGSEQSLVMPYGPVHRTVMSYGSVTVETLTTVQKNTKFIEKIVASSKGTVRYTCLNCTPIYAYNFSTAQNETRIQIARYSQSHFKMVLGY